MNPHRQHPQHPGCGYGYVQQPQYTLNSQHQQYGGGNTHGFIPGQGQSYVPPTQNYNNTVDKDQVIRNAIDQIFLKYDQDNSGFLEEKEFQNSLGELCIMLNKPAPKSYNQFIQIAKSIDSNYDGRIGKVEVFNLFKRLYGY